MENLPRVLAGFAASSSSSDGSSSSSNSKDEEMAAWREELCRQVEEVSRVASSTDYTQP